MANDLSTAFEISVILSIVDRFSHQLQNYVKMLDNVDTSTRAAERAVADIQKTMAVGAGLTAYAIGGAFALTKMAEAAGKLQTAMTGVQYSMKLTTNETTSLTREVMNTGIPTIFSAVDVSGIAASMARSGIPNYQTLKNLLPLYTDFADVQTQMKGENANTVTADATVMAHAYSLYSQKQLSPFLNTLDALLLHDNESMSMVATEWRYTSGVSKLLGLSSEQALTTLGFANRLGLGSGRGGQDTAQFMQHLVPGAQGGALNIAAMEAAGFVNAAGKSIFLNNHGDFIGWQKTIQYLSTFASRMHNDSARMLPLLDAAFGQAGGKLAMRLVSPNADTLYNQTLAQIQHTGSITSLQQHLNQTYQGQTKQFKTTMADIFTTLGLNGVLGPATGFLRVLNHIAGAVLRILQRAPWLDKLIGGFLLLSTAVAAVIGPMMMMNAAWQIMKLTGNDTLLKSLWEGMMFIAEKTKIAAAAQWVFDAAMDANPIALIIIGVAALAAGIAVLIAHWKQVTDWLKHVWQWFDHLGTKSQWLVAMIMPFIGIPAMIIAHWQPIEKFFEQLGKDIEHVGEAVGHFFGIGNGQPVTVSTALGNTAANANTTSVHHGDVHLHVRFEQGSIVTSDPKQAADLMISNLKSSPGKSLAKSLLDQSRSTGRRAQPVAP